MICRICRQMLTFVANLYCPKCFKYGSFDKYLWITKEGIALNLTSSPGTEPAVFWFFNQVSLISPKQKMLPWQLSYNVLDHQIHNSPAPGIDLKTVSQRCALCVYNHPSEAVMSLGRSCIVLSCLTAVCCWSYGTSFSSLVIRGRFIVC
jgi:hypothetical protein